MITHFLGIPKNVEVLLLIIIGIGILFFDSSPFYMRANLNEVWEYNFDPKLSSDNTEKILKYILCGVIFIRTFTLHIFLALYIVMLWPVIFGERPNLLIPWLSVGLVRCLIVNFVSLVIGTYICLVQKGWHSICLDFALAQFIEHGPSVYAWFSVLSFYKNLHLYCKRKQRRSHDYELSGKRKRAKCMDGTNLSQGSGSMNFSSESTLLGSDDELGDKIVTSSSRSLDTLLKLRLEEGLADDADSFESIQEDDNISICQTGKEMLNAVDEAVSEFSDKDITLKDLKEINVVPVSDIKIGKSVCKSSCASSRNETTITEIKQQATTSENENKKCKCPKIQNSKETELHCVPLEKINCSGGSPNSTSTTIVEETGNNGTAAAKDFLEDNEEVLEIANFVEFVFKIQKGVNFGCQVNTLSKSLLNQPPQEVTRKYSLSKKFIIDHISIK